MGILGSARFIYKLTLFLFNESTEPNDSLTVRNHEMRLHEINTLEWDELVVANDPSGSTAPREGKH